MYETRVEDRIDDEVHQIYDLPQLPIEVQRLVAEVLTRANGQPILAIALLEERVICDASICDDRAMLFRWLADQAGGSKHSLHE